MKAYNVDKIVLKSMIRNNLGVMLVSSGNSWQIEPQTGLLNDLGDMIYYHHLLHRSGMLH